MRYRWKKLVKDINFYDNFQEIIPFYSHSRNGEVMTEKGKKFWENKIDTRIFSNLYECKCDIEGKNWDSTEHYFQIYKYCEGDRNFMEKLNSGEVASFGQRRLHLKSKHLQIIAQLEKEGKAIPLKPDGEHYKSDDKASPVLMIKDWDKVKIDVMYKAIKAKFSQHSEMKEMLLATGNGWLIEHTKNDFQWADGNDGSGKNYLGKLLVFLRHNIVNGEEKQPSREFLEAPMTTFVSYAVKD